MVDKTVLFGTVLGIVSSFMNGLVASIIGMIIIGSAVHDSISKRRLM